MNCYGIFGCYLLEFGYIIGQMQYDLFYIYMVDVYIFNLIKYLCKLNWLEMVEKYLLVSKIIDCLFKLELIYIVGFYYDIVKGCGGDYLEFGVVDVEVFCQSYQLLFWDI